MLPAGLPGPCIPGTSHPCKSQGSVLLLAHGALESFLAGLSKGS